MEVIFMFSGKRFKLWHGLMGFFSVMLCFSFTAGTIVEAYRTDIDKFIGTSSYVKTEDTRTAEEQAASYRYKSDYSSTKELVLAVQDMNERLQEEGSVLLKNNGALPLSAEETGKISLLGFSSYFPTRGGDLGAQIDPGYNADTDSPMVDFTEALAARDCKINPVLEKMYTSEKMKEAVQATYTTGSKDISQSQYNAASPATEGV